MKRLAKLIATSLINASGLPLMWMLLIVYFLKLVQTELAVKVV